MGDSTRKITQIYKNKGISGLIDGLIGEIPSQRVHCLYFGRLRGFFGAPLRPGFYNIDPQHPEVGPFELYLPFGRANSSPAFSHLHYVHTDRIFGDYEPCVFDALMEQVRGKACFWEIGAQFGYFSMAVAPFVQRVIAIDALRSNSELVEKSARRNQYRNVSVLTAEVGANVQLDELLTKNPEPDVILMDIEGWEWRTLSNASTIFDLDVCWIVEVHKTPQAEAAPPDFSPEESKHVVELFREKGFNVSWLDSEKHIVAKRPEIP